MDMNPYSIVSELEKAVAEYAGSKYAVAVDSCTNALLLSLKYCFLSSYNRFVEIPNYTYVGVAYSIINAGGLCRFRDENWEGNYILLGTNIIDSARRFKRGMYIKGTLYCISCHWSKHLKIGRGGFILTFIAPKKKNGYFIIRIYRPFSSLLNKYLISSLGALR